MKARTTRTRDKDDRDATNKHPRPDTKAIILNGIAEIQDLVGTPTANDGTSDLGIRVGGYEGGRDAKIQELKDQRTAVVQQEHAVEAEIKELQASIGDDKGVVGTVGNIADVAAPFVGAIGSIFGMDNPIASAANRALGVEDQEKNLKARQAELADQHAALDTTIDALQQEVQLNFMTDVAYATGLPESIVTALDGAAGIDIVVEDATSLGGDAEYDSGTNTVTIDAATMASVQEHIDVLQDAGIVDGNGNIIDAAQFDDYDAATARPPVDLSKAFSTDATIGGSILKDPPSADAVNDAINGALGTTILIGTHEIMTHGSQDYAGTIELAITEGADIIHTANQTAMRFGGEDRTAIIDSGYEHAEENRVDLVEYDAYVNQETMELQAGKVKQGFITMNADGSLLPREEAIDNIVAIQQHAPLPYGPSAGQSFGGEDSSNEDETAPGDDAPGRQAPGSDAPGRQAPGRQAPGLDAPGRQAPGRQAPGRQAP